MAIYARILQETPIRLWGLSARERFARMFRKAGISLLPEGVSPDKEKDSLLLLRGDFLYDQRILKNMTADVGILLEIDTAAGRRPVAAHVPLAMAEPMEAILRDEVGVECPDGLRRETPMTLVPVYLLKSLTKLDPPYLLKISEHNQRMLEKRLFAGSYKGVTDLVTKWVWPAPAQWATRFCTRHGIVPNHVTSLSLILSILALAQFYYGFYAWGLMSAWLMTFLDTVDGKLARVTINYSSFGNIFDHAIDLIFPPLWYLAWGMSLHMAQSGIPGVSMSLVFWLILAGYIAGRLVELIFKQFLESSGIFCWRLVDSCFRLITGRRNPNLLLLTLSHFFGRPDLGLLAVCLWTVLSSLFLIVRLFMGVRTRFRSGPLRSWFLDVDPVNDRLTMCQRWFYRRPDADAGGNG